MPIGNLLTGSSNLLKTLFGSSSGQQGTNVTSGNTTGTGDVKTTGTTTTSGGTNTTQNTVNLDAINGAIRSIMEGPNGLASIFSGAKRAGGYGSTDAAFETNDLVAKIAQTVGQLTSGTTTTIGGTTTKTDNAVTSNSTSTGTTAGSNVTSSTNSGICFLTTAACQYMELADDCWQLQTLRKFRDGWLAKNHPGVAEQYYSLSNSVTDYINKSSYREEILNWVWIDIVSLCCNLISLRKYEEAYVQYGKSLITILAAITLDKNNIGIAFKEGEYIGPTYYDYQHPENNWR